MKGADLVKAEQLEDGAEYFSFWTKTPLPADTKMNVDTEITVDMKFSDATLIARDLSVVEILDGMGRIVGAIRNEFIKLNPDPS